MNEQQSDPVETQQPAEQAPPTDKDTAFERYMDHKDKLETSRADSGNWHRDCISAYHRMGMNYNAYLSGEKVNGMPVTKADVFVSGIRFYQSNIIETAIIRAVKFACNSVCLNFLNTQDATLNMSRAV